MPLITDPDQLLQGSEVTLDTTNLTMKLNLAGNLSEDGVTLQAYYSFLKEEWVNEVNGVHRYTFPMLSITPEQFEIGNNGSRFSDWSWLDDPTRKLLRSAGWREYDAAGNTTRIYFCVITLGNIDAVDKVNGDRAYYAFSSDSSAVEFTYAGPVNEAVQILGDSNNGDFDVRLDELTVYIREQGKTYDQSSTSDIGLSATSNIAARFPLSESVDNNITATDSEIETQAPYILMRIRYQGEALQLPGGGTNLFGVEIEGNGGSAEQIYEFVQHALRQPININDDPENAVHIGNLQDPLLRFTGENLSTLSVTNDSEGGTGVMIDNFDANDTNRLTFIDNNGVAFNFPFVAAGALVFNTNIIDDVAARYWLFFENAGGNLVDSDNAIIIADTNNADISGTVSGAASVPFDFDYDGNIQGGRTPGTDANYVLRIQGLGNAQFAEVAGTITRATGQNISVTSALERNYINN